MTQISSRSASAQRGDHVMQRSTGKHGWVIGGTDDGRLLVSVYTGKHRASFYQRWERWDTAVIAEPLQDR